MFLIKILLSILSRNTEILRNMEVPPLTPNFNFRQDIGQSSFDVPPDTSNLTFQQYIGKFSLALYGESTITGNEIMSPYSICSALMLLTLGTAGSTKNQMISSIFKSAEPRDVHSEYKILNDKITTRRSHENSLLTANKLFISKLFTIFGSYKTKAVKYYGGETQKLDFGPPHTEQSRQTINNWIETNTNNKIRDMIPRGVLDAHTVVVLANAVYFKGTWKTKFDPRKTKKRSFVDSLNNQHQVDMMYGKFRAMSGENTDLGCKILQLPYVGDALSMVFLLPDAVSGLLALENNLDYLDIESLLSGLQFQDTIIRIPKFKIEAEYDLKPMLMNLRMTEIFDRNIANFSNMVTPEINSQGVYVSDVRHKAFIELNEEGSEAAATTVIYHKVSLHWRRPKPFKFVADRPFIFIIRDNETGTVLFIGKYVRP